MPTKVTGGASVAVGDTVAYCERGEFRSPPPVICTVVRITRTGMTVKLPNGSTINRAFRTTYRVRSWGGGIGEHYNFGRLDGRERWLRELPAGLSAVTDYQRGLVSVVLTDEDIRNHLTTSNRLAELAAWLAREVPAGTP